MVAIPMRLKWRGAFNRLGQASQCLAVHYCPLNLSDLELRELSYPLALPDELYG